MTNKNCPPYLFAILGINWYHHSAVLQVKWLEVNNPNHYKHKQAALPLCCSWDQVASPLCYSLGQVTSSQQFKSQQTQRSHLTTLLFLGSSDWKCRAICRMASRRSTRSSVCLMFLAFPSSSSSPLPHSNSDTSDRERRRWRLFSCWENTIASDSGVSCDLGMSTLVCRC